MKYGDLWCMFSGSVGQAMKIRTLCNINHDKKKSLISPDIRNLLKNDKHHLIPNPFSSHTNFTILRLKMDP